MQTGWNDLIIAGLAHRKAQRKFKFFTKKSFLKNRTANSPLVKSVDFCGQWRPTEMNLVGNQVIAREEANAKGINFDRVVLELVMKMNRMQVFEKLVRTF